MVVALAAVVAVTLAAPEQAEVELFHPGAYAPSEALPKDGSQVLALCGGELRPMKLEAATGRDGRVHLSVACDARILLRGFEGFTAPKKTRTARIKAGPPARSSPFGPNFVTLRLGNRTWRVDRIRLGSTGYRLLLRDGVGGKQAVLYEAQSTDAARWELLWAGDLDGDARIDLIVDAADAFDQSEIRLYLSRGAEEAVDECAAVRRRR